jgi:proteasome lid subunit RPN8/RPN11
MRVAISSRVLDQIMAHAAAEPAREVCGLLFGAETCIERAVPAANVAADPVRHFEVDPQALFVAIRAERAGGPRLVGPYHSHPSGSPDPSLRDAADAEPGRLWLIVADGEARLWRSVAAGGFVPLLLDTRRAG